jgi:8-oxo-dGTP pyrophosphatase MutT (NUDIX family)
MERFSLRCAVYLILIQEGRVLLARRANTGYKDGQFGLPSGHLDGGECAKVALAREANEEIGIRVSPSDLRLVYTLHRRSTGGGKDYEYIDLYFVADTWKGVPTNCEPDFCSEVSWHEIEDLPEETIDFIRHVLSESKTGNIYSEFGF